MDLAYVFGALGNLETASGSGWSVEDDFAWAIGRRATLTVSLPLHDGPCVLRFDIRPAVFPPAAPRQRLSIRSGGEELAAVEMTGRETVTVNLPLDLTENATQLTLDFEYPDAVCPRDFIDTVDTRTLGFCFYSITISVRDDSAAAVSRLEPAHGLIFGDYAARQIAEIAGKLPSLRGRCGWRFVDALLPLDQALAALPPGVLDSARFCWVERSLVTEEIRAQLYERLPKTCLARGYYVPTCQSLWPFLAADYRSVAEPSRYFPFRYPYGDRLAVPLSMMRMPDDVLYSLYDAAAEQDPVDLDDLHDADIRRARAEGRRSHLDVHDVIRDRFPNERLFSAPDRPAPPLLREMAFRMINGPWMQDIATPAAIGAELDALMEGHLGWRIELPVHRRVARHFGLPWWSETMRYRRHNNRTTQRAYILDYIKWADWLP